MADQPEDRGRRSFLGIALPVEVRRALTDAMATLAGSIPNVKWTRKEENLHITMKFLGRVGEEQLERLNTTLAGRLAPLSSFTVRVQNIGAFPSTRRASVIWAGVDDPTGGLAYVADAVEQTAANLGIGEREDRPFRAHVTLGRAKPFVDIRPALDGQRTPLSPAETAPFTFGSVAVNDVHLYESHLSPLGSTYSLQARFPLRASPGPRIVGT